MEFHVVTSVVIIPKFAGQGEVGRRAGARASFEGFFSALPE
jgi:hypothetical protein